MKGKKEEVVERDVVQLDIPAEELQAIQEKKKPEPRFFEFGDAWFDCNRCGTNDVLQTGIKDGMQFILPTSDQHEWRLMCPKCRNMKRIYFKESNDDTIKEAKEQIAIDEAKQREEAEKATLEKAKKEHEDERNSKGKKKRLAKRSSKTVERKGSDDGTGDATAPTDD